MFGTLLFLGSTSTATAADPATTAICVGEQSIAPGEDPKFKLKGEGTVSNLPNASSITITVRFYRVVPAGADNHIATKIITANGVSGTYNYLTSQLDLTGADIPSTTGTEYYTKVEVLANSTVIPWVTSPKTKLTKP